MFKFFTPIYQQSKLNQWVNMLSVALLLITIFRAIEWSLILSFHSISGALPIWELSGLLHDYYTVSFAFVVLGVLHWLISFIHVKVARFIVLSIFLTLFLFHIILVFYFKESLTPLSVSDIYGMSQNQVEFISEIYGFKMVYLFGIIPIVFILIFVFNVLSRLIKFKVIRILAIALLGLSFGKQLLKPVSGNSYESELNYHIVSNKLYFFGDSWFTYHDDLRLNADQFIPTTEFPFYTNSEVKDVLSPFFNESERPPNIVFIISESLGKQYSGKDARLGSYTPFLDSLADHGLYWQNMIANAERTFGAIPNLMTGLPEGERGFLNQRWNMPDHLSLPLVLKEKNNYQTSFFCGAWKHFDNMADYVMFQKFDFVLGKFDFKENLINHDNSDFDKLKNWGAEDYQVFKQSMEFMDQNYDAKLPFFNLYLSTSFHQPYAYTGQERFDARAKEIIKANVPKESQEEYLKHQTDFGAILYADYSMQQVFEMYREAGLFENTIFVICGDHSLKFMNDNPRLEKFHIPLLIYSPLLKRSKSFKSVVCQKDVPSSLQALLKNKFNLNLPHFSISQSNNLDTLQNLSFENSEFVMMYSNKRLTNYVKNDMLLSDDMLFKMEENLSIKRIDNEKKLEDLKSKLLYYKAVNRYVCENNKLLSPSILEKYSTLNYQLEFFNDYTFTKLKNFKTDSLSNNVYYSKPKSVKVLNRKFIHLLSDQPVDLNTRVRVTVKFKLNSPSGYLPQLVINHSNPDLNRKVFYLKTNSDYLKKTDKENWLSVEAAYWIESGVTDTINAYLFNADKGVLFIDDLDIKIRDF